MFSIFYNHWFILSVFAIFAVCLVVLGVWVWYRYFVPAIERCAREARYTYALHPRLLKLSGVLTLCLFEGLAITYAWEIQRAGMFGIALWVFTHIVFAFLVVRPFVRTFFAWQRRRVERQETAVLESNVRALYALPHYAQDRPPTLVALSRLSVPANASVPSLLKAS